jgi:hypothetical protein
MSALIIRALKITIDTPNGNFGTFIKLSDGFNILRAKNSKGKSSVINSVLYALGFEEILGGQNAKVMKPVLKDEIKFNGSKYKVLDSKVQLEISNGEKTITITRWVTSLDKDPRLVRVEKGPALTNDDAIEYDMRDLYVHLSGAAINESGFHAFLASFIGWNLPLVPTFDGIERTLYMQTLVPLFFKEQIRGWNALYAQPNTTYGIRDLSKRAIEFLLALNVMENMQYNEELKIRKLVLTQRWQSITDFMKETANEVNIVLEGISDKPDLQREIQFKVLDDEQGMIELSTRILNLREKVSTEQYRGKIIKENQEEQRKKLNLLELQLISLQDKHNSIRYELQNEISNQKALSENIQKMETDLQKNIEAKKLYSLGSELFSSNLSEGKCPTCQQNFHDTLLPQDIDFEPMSFDENITFIKEQLSALKFGQNQSNRIKEIKEKQMNSVEDYMHKVRSEIKLLKIEMREDPRMPSTIEIEQMIQNKIELSKLVDAETKLEKNSKKLNQLKIEWAKYLEDYKNRSKEYFSGDDMVKLMTLESKFKEYLSSFGFSSINVNEIQISEDKYMPVVNGFDIKVDSSASDHVRMIWAYVTSLIFVSNKFAGNHPGILVLDEPGQHQMDSDSISDLFNVLSEITGQSIVASSLTLSEITKLTAGQNVTILDLGDEEIIKPVES